MNTREINSANPTANQQSQVTYVFRKLNSQFAYTRDPNTVKSGKGVYTGKEWANTRKLSDKLFSEPNDLNFRKSSYPELTKYISAFNLCKKIDFTSFAKLGDIGGIPFFQALVIYDLNPHLRMLLTDYDRDSCDALKSYSRFSNFEIQSFDATKEDYNIFSDCDVLTMWGVDPALSDLDLLRLFKYIKASNQTLLIGSLDVEPAMLNYTVYKGINLINEALRAALKFILKINKPTRMHGILRNENYFRKLSLIAGVKLQTVQVDKPRKYRIYKITSR